MPNVSVIIPCYNSAKTIRETIESVLAQTYQDFEIIVVDDGSKDESKDIIKSFGKNVKYIYQENQGQAAARNSAIRSSESKYLAFLDSDDLWHYQKLEKQLNFMQVEKVDWCYCDCEYFLNESGKIIGTYSKDVFSPKIGWVADELLMGNFIASPTPVVLRDILLKAGYFDESIEIRSREDWEEWIRIAILSKIGYLPEVLAKYRIHENSITYLENPTIAFQGHMSVINKLSNQFPDKLAHKKNEAISYYAAKFSRSHFLQKKYDDARTLNKIAISGSSKIYYKFLNIVYNLPRFFLNFIVDIRSIVLGEK